MISDEAKARSLEARKHRAAIRRRLKSGEELAHCVVQDPLLAKVYVREILGWQRGWGPLKIGACLAAMGAFNPTCASLTEEQIAIMSYYCCWDGKGLSTVPPRPPTARPRHPADR